MATETQTKLVGFCLGNKTNYSATTYANHIWFDPTNKQILLNGIEYIPKKLSELVNDKNFITSITKAMVENVLTGNITSHTHFSISTEGDNRNVATTPNDYSNKFVFKGLKYNYKIGSPAGGDYSYLIGLRGWHDSSGGQSHELAFNNSGIYRRQGATTEWGSWAKMLDSDNYASYALPLSGGTLTGALTCNGSYINMNGDSGAKGYKGYFNQSGTSNRASGSHVFMGNGQALGSNAISLGYNAFAGIRNQAADKGTYPYIAWQWMPTEKIHITINNQDTANGEFYGYEVLGGKMVQYELGGNTYTYENTSTKVRVLVCVKDDADTGLIFGGKYYMPFNATKTLISGKYILGRGESITAVNTVTVGEVNYYVLAIYTWSATVGYDYSTQVKVMCATKVNNSNYNGASSYASGYYSVASGASSVASGQSSVASGLYSVASGAYSVASGYYSVASGAYSVASGSSSVASGNYSVASGYYSVASGASSVASGQSSVASGQSSVASGAYSVASGLYSVASHDHCAVLARNGETQSSYQTIIGRYNAKVSGLFIIGNGSSSARSNAFVVDESGNVTAKYFSGYANAVGGEGFKIYPENTNQINFGGTGSDTTIVFGAASKDSRSVPTTYKFGADGKATLLGSADMLDGYHETSFFRFRGQITNNTDCNNLNYNGVWFNTTGNGSGNSNFPNTYGYIVNCGYYYDDYSGVQLSFSDRGTIYTRVHFESWRAWKQIAFTDSSITGNAATASSLTSLTSSDEASATDTWRKVWISYDNGVTGRPALSSNLAYQVSTNTLKVGNLTNVGDITFSAANKNIGTSSVPLSVLWANSVFSSTTLLIGAGTSVMTFDKDGNVAIGKSSVSKYKLDVSGSIYSMSGGITSADGFIKLNSSDSYVLLGGGGHKAVGDFATSAVATASADGLMSSAMFKAEMVKSVNVRQGAANLIEGGSIRDHNVYITQKKNNITNAYQQVIGENDVTIPNATKDYDGSMSYTDKRKLDGISPYAPKKVVALRLSYTYGGVTVISGGGDYDMTQDAKLMQSASSDGVGEDYNGIHYYTTFSLDTAASSTNTLNQLFNNSFVKFSFMGKDTSYVPDTVDVKSSFDGNVLYVVFSSLDSQETWVVDCVWEFF